MEITATEVYNIALPGYSDVLKVKEVGKALGISPKLVYRLLNNGEIKYKKTGRVFLIPKKNVLEYLGILDSPICKQPTA